MAIELKEIDVSKLENNFYTTDENSLTAHLITDLVSSGGTNPYETSVDNYFSIDFSFSGIKTFSLVIIYLLFN